jgi:DNA-binding HxlR family transcriptional regulator
VCLIATNILSNQLLRLVQHGLVEKRALAQHSGRDAYVLSEKGKTLMPLLNAVTEWGLAQLPGTEAKLRPQQKKP